MKKITLALCACAFALTGLLASCSNESTSADYIYRNNASHEYKYAVYGTVTTTTKKEGLGSSEYFLDKDMEKFTSTSTNTYKISNGDVTVSWYTDETRNSNYTNYYINGEGIAEASSSSSNTYDGDSTGSSKGTSTTTFGIYKTFTEVDGTLYINIDNNLVKIEDLAISEDDDAFSGDFGGEFSWNFKITNDKFYNSYDEDTNTKKDAKYAQSSTTEYKLTFVPVESFDPEDIEDEE